MVKHFEGQFGTLCMALRKKAHAFRQSDINVISVKNSYKLVVMPVHKDFYKGIFISIQFSNKQKETFLKSGKKNLMNKSYWK